MSTRQFVLYLSTSSCFIVKTFPRYIFSKSSFHFPPPLEMWGVYLIYVVFVRPKVCGSRLKGVVLCIIRTLSCCRWRGSHLASVWEQVSTGKLTPVDSTDSTDSTEIFHNTPWCCPCSFVLNTLTITNLRGHASLCRVPTIAQCAHIVRDSNNSPPPPPPDTTNTNCCC